MHFRKLVINSEVIIGSPKNKDSNYKLFFDQKF